MIPFVTIMMNCSKERKSDFDRMVDSCLNQKGVKVQLIVTTIQGDDCIRWYDGEMNVIPRLEHPGRNPNGSFYQINQSLHLIKGDYFLWVGSDDKLNLDKCIIEIEGNPGGICYTDYHLSDRTLKDNHLVLSDYDYKKHLTGNFIPDCTVIPKKFFHLLPFRTGWYNCGYWDFWLRVAEDGGSLKHLAIPTWYYIQRKFSMHIKRKRNPQERRMFDQAKKDMISSHDSSIGVIS